MSGGGPRDECLGCGGKAEVGGDGARKEAAVWLLELLDVRIIETGGKKGYEELVKTGGGPGAGDTRVDCGDAETDEIGAAIEKLGRRLPVAAAAAPE